MSAIVGILQLDGAPVSELELEAMLAEVAHRGPDGQRSALEGAIGLGSSLLRTNSHAAAGPERLEGLTGVADATLTHRRQLCGQLADRGAPATEKDSDLRLLLHAYATWGDRCVEHLRGDFSMVLWDADRRRLFAARDAIGVRQLFYFRSDDRLLLATDMAAILAVEPRSRRLNEVLLVEFLADRYSRWYSETALEPVGRLPPGHTLTAADSVAITGPSWLVEPPPPVRDPAEATRRFQEVFAEAVHERTLTDHPLAFEVSGGLDSSSIASLARELWSQTPGSRRPTLYSTTCRRFPAADERRYLQPLIEACAPWPAVTLDGDERWPLKQSADDGGFRPAEPEISLSHRDALDLMKRIGADGHRVLLNGYGGDQVLLGDAYGQPERLSELGFAGALREWHHFREHHRPGTLFYRGLVRPTLRRFIPQTALDWRRRRQATSEAYLPAWISRQGREILYSAPPLKTRPPESGPDHAILSTLWSGYWQRGLTSLDYLSALHRVERRYPYLDLPLVQLLRSLPAEILFREGWTKWILRQALAGTLPDPIRTRRSYAIVDELVAYSWRDKERARIEALLRDSRTVSAGWVEFTAISRAWQRYWAGDDRDMWTLSAWINCELWLRGAGSKAGV